VAKKRMETDVLVIGAGIAGGAAALAAARGGCRVTVLAKSKNPESSSNTYWAQGGIIHRGRADSAERLVKDILAAGAGNSDPRAARFLATRGPQLVKRLLIEELGVPFDRRRGGALHFTEEAAHSVPRILHVGDVTGQAITERMLGAIRQEKNIRLLRNASAVDLLTLSHHSCDPLDVYRPPTCFGAYVLLREKGEVVPITAAETVLATGGLGRLFLHTTNPNGARGDGIAMAYRAGARIINLEYVQFHPTALYHRHAERFLISESVRGEGGELIRRDGTAFMKRRHRLGSLAPRDVVARAIHEEMLESGDPCVYLDITHRDADWIRGRFPQIHARCLDLGIDIARQPIPVVPAAHYACGGVAVDLQGRTSIRRLRALGEVSCTGLHGANRLASTSLLEGLVWGHTAGEAIAKVIRQAKEPPHLPAIEPWRPETEAVDPALILQDWLMIKHTMWNYVGLVRSTKRIKRALQLLRELQQEIEEFYDRAKLNDALLGLRNGCQAALAVVYAALQNHESRGCHYRVD
jgi:L-aspartate oxidase